MDSMPKVLIVDDEHACRDSLRLLLSLEDFDIRMASSGDEAIDIAEEFQPDVVIVDWLLRNGMDGLDVVVALRERNPSVQAVVVTGYPSDELEDRIKALPDAQYLAKPFAPDELIAATHRAAALANDPAARV